MGGGKEISDVVAVFHAPPFLIKVPPQLRQKDLRLLSGSTVIRGSIGLDKESQGW
jgi:hypothetical protein